MAANGERTTVHGRPRPMAAPDSRTGCPGRWVRNEKEARSGTVVDRAVAA